MNESECRELRDPPPHDDIDRSGQCPYTREPYPAMCGGPPWTMRQIAPSPRSRTSNA